MFGYAIYSFALGCLKLMRREEFRGEKYKKITTGNKYNRIKVNKLILYLFQLILIS